MSELEKAENSTQVELTTTQKETGDYIKGKVTLNNIPITIENPKGSIRSGTSPEGEKWESKIYFTYGYIDNSIGSDGDEIDIFLGPLADSNKEFFVYIINQVNPTNLNFDEQKVMFGFSSSEEAKKAYLSCYEKGWKGYGSMEQISLPGFILWVESRSSKTFINQLNLIKNEVSKESMKLIKLEGEVFEGKTLLDLQKQAGDLTGIKTLVVSIGSPGGDVSEGIKIMMWFDHLSSIGIKVVTLVVSNAYSIASLIMLAADHTLIAKDADVMVHNPMIPDLRFVNANELEQHVKDLRELESTMYELYEIFTELPTEKIKELMDNETYLTAEDAIKYGFADEVANIEKRPKVMAISKLKLVNMKKTLNILHQVVALVSGSAVVNQFYYDDKGGEVEINQQDPSTYSKGDRTSIENGQVVLQDGTILNVVDWCIDSIEKNVVNEIPVVEPVEVPAPVIEANFNEGAAPVIEEKSPGMVIETTKTETTKTEPVAIAEDEVVAKKRSMIEEGEEIQARKRSMIEEEKKFEAKKRSMFGEGDEPKMSEGEGEETVTIPLEEFREMAASFKLLVARVQNLEEGTEKVEEQMKASSQFEEIATEAISMIAKNTSSSFRPSAKSTVEEPSRGSIFQQARAKVQAMK
ncbi:MAG: ClpP [Caudoviricetes sp.]|nr:MAG: ClpP [Caudoviricetes sp.]